MQIETIQMDPRIARIHYADYMKKCRQHRAHRREKLEHRAKEAGRKLGQIRIEKTQMEKEDEHLKKLYLELKRGHQILNLPRTWKEAGLNEQQLPVLAICSATAKWCRISISGQSLEFYENRSRDRVRIDSKYIPAEITNYSWRNTHKYPTLWSVKAMVPSVPVSLRPDDLEKYHILWEAVWDDIPPVDPILLRRVDPKSDINWVVVAKWDLTPIEQFVLEGRQE